MSGNDKRRSARHVPDIAVVNYVKAGNYTNQQLKVQQTPVELHTAVTAAALLPS